LKSHKNRNQRATTMTIREAALRTGVDVEQIKAAAQAGAIRSWMAYTSRVVNVDSLNAWLRTR